LRRGCERGGVRVSCALVRVMPSATTCVASSLPPFVVVDAFGSSIDVTVNGIILAAKSDEKWCESGALDRGGMI